MKFFKRKVQDCWIHADAIRGGDSMAAIRWRCDQRRKPRRRARTLPIGGGVVQESVWNNDFMEMMVPTVGTMATKMKNEDDKRDIKSEQ